MRHSRITFRWPHHADNPPQHFRPYAHGLAEEQALAALTVVPAQLLGIEDEVGRIESGMLTNLLIADGNLFSKGTKVLECWVAGERFVIGKKSRAEVPDLTGKWELSVRYPDARDVRLGLELEGAEGKISGSVFVIQNATKSGKQRKQKNKRNTI